jgi:hypothetical protein
LDGTPGCGCRSLSWAPPCSGQEWGHGADRDESRRVSKPADGLSHALTRVSSEPSSFPQVATMEVDMQLSQSSTGFSIAHVNVATGLPYDRLIEAFERSLGRWDPVAGEPLWKQRANWPAVEAAIAKMAEPFGLMVFAKIDQGRITSLSGKSKMCSIWLATR